MRKYCVLGIAALAFLHPAESHIHNHNKRGGQLTRHEMNIRQEQRCSKEPPTTTTLTIHVDEFGHTLDASPSTTSVIAVSNERETTPSSILSVTAAATSFSLISTTSLLQPLPSLSSPSSSSPSRASKRMQPDRYVAPPAIDISHRSTNSDPLAPDLISGISNSLFGHGKYGISYTAYNDDGTCKTQDQVDSDMAQLRQFAFVRFYGVDCNQAQTISKAARGNNMQVFAGVFDIQNMNNDLQKIIDAADGDWSTFHTVSVGNELVNRGQSSPAEVIGAVNSARNRLRQAGYQGPVVTVDTFNQIIAHPELCDASDYCAANCHAFFDSNQTAENAGPYVLEQARQVSQAMKDGNKGVIITETGWPSAGEANGAAVPSRHNQIVALKSLKQSFPDGGVVFFSAFNEKWKQDNAWTFGTEKNWGLFDFSDTKDAISEILNPLKGNGV